MTGHHGQRRVALVIASLSGGGAERAVSELAGYWAARSVSVFIVTLEAGDGAAAYDTDPRVVVMPVTRPGPSGARWRHSLRSFGIVLRLRSALRRIAPDVVISFVDVANVIAILATRGLHMPVAVAERTHPGENHALPRHWAVLRRYLYRRASLVLAQTQDAADWLAAECKVRPAVIPNALRELPVPGADREPLILCVGRLSPEKGFDVALRAFAHIRHQHPEWRLTILGEGPQRAALEALRAELGLADVASMPGWVSDVEAWLARASVALQPSRFEGFPNAVLEGMGMGLVVISTVCRAGPQELIRDGVNGRLVNVDDVAATAAALDTVLSNAQLRHSLGTAAMDVRRSHSAARVNRQWDRLVLALAATEKAG